MKAKINNVLHVLLMFGLIYQIFEITGHDKFSDNELVIGILLISAIASPIIGFGLEFSQDFFRTGSYSKLDMILYTTGGILGGIASLLFYHQLNTLSILFISLYVGVAIYDILKSK